DFSVTNQFYVGNRPPLEPARFIALPDGAVRPAGWLREFLNRQRDGLCGHLGEISAWLQKDDNAWLSQDGKGKYGWEELPYWLRGYLSLGYVLNDPKIIAESKIWIEGALASQRADGDFGPDQRFDDDGSRDYWANMLMLFCLQSYYESTQDARVLAVMTKYFHYQLGVPDEKFLTHYWQKMRGGDNLYSVYWLYNRTGNAELLQLAEKIHRCTADWEQKDNLPNWHNVNIAECFREPAEHYLQTHNLAELQAAYADFNEVRKRYGQVPGGMFGGDENCRPGHTDPHQAVETCGMVEQMLSDELMQQISGDPFWADQCEDVAFNSYPAAVLPDFRALRYLTAPNLAVSDARNHAPGVQNSGPFLLMNPFSARCCQHNHSMGWPYFTKHLWLASPDNGLCAALYAASEVSARVGRGATVRLTEETHYPFEGKIKFTLQADGPVKFPLYLRLPGWCPAATAAVNGRAVKAELTAGKYLRIERLWSSRDTVTLELPMKISVRQWTANHDSVSINYGPLTFSLKIGERYERKDSARTAIGDSAWQKGADPSQWPSFEIYPTTPWNYGLVLDPARPESSLAVKQRAWPKDDFPFTPDSAPVNIIARAKLIPEWTLDRNGLCAALQDSPVAATGSVRKVTLIPMGAARLRIAAFPTASAAAGAHQWRPAAGATNLPQCQATASHCNPADTLDGLNGGFEPASSNDHNIPRMTWWDHRGTVEWVQYDFAAPRNVSSTSVYWFDDTGEGQCRVPVSWRLLYWSGGVWVPPGGAADFTVKKDAWNRVDFPPVETGKLRIEAELQSPYSGGLLGWRVE
ncbi:MAG: glycoside hydrolase family 127 protein, partial [Verrucomicrobiae bacterium]|nr:glycoside hydrolase family 127 protein [Verrucomicrobiae bacterium]